MEEIISKIQKVLQVDFETILDDSYFFEGETDFNNNIYVTASKFLDSNVARIFPAITVNISSQGRINFSFFSNLYSPQIADSIRTLISDLYKNYISDDNGQCMLSPFDLNDLYSSNPSPKYLTWNNNEISLSIDRGISFSLDYIPSKPQHIIETYFRPNINITANGLLQSHENKLAEIEVSLLTDDFTKERTLQITKLSGLTENYIYTYPFNHFDGLKDLKPLELGFSFIYSNKTFFLETLCIGKDFGLAKGDDVIFLLEDDITIIIKYSSGGNYNNSGSIRNVEGLSYDQMKLFATKNVKKWKLTNKKKGFFEVGGFIYNETRSQYKNQVEGQFLFRNMARKVIQGAIIHEGNYYNESSPELLP